MRVLEIVVALIFALVAFAVIKAIGFVVHVALVCAAIGLVAGFLLARLLRRK